MAAMASWDLLDEKVESDLHKSRLLNIEEKPFKRITKRIATISALASEAKQSGASSKDGAQAQAKGDNEHIKDDLLLDFAAFDSSITRLQFLCDANERERVRYQADQERILAECHAVRANNAQLREQLDEARATLTQRKKFDELADKITSNKLLRPRDDQVANLAKLEDECRELERESETYTATWRERRDQFNRIMEEGMLLRRQIRDEKEEVDRREGMDEGGDERDDDDVTQTPRIVDPTGSATPRPDGGDQHTHQQQAKTNASDAGGTPRPDMSQGGRTPSAATPIPDSLKPPHASVSRTGSTAASRDVTPAPQADESGADNGNDVDMEDSGPSADADDEEDDAVHMVQFPSKGGDSMEMDS